MDSKEEPMLRSFGRRLIKSGVAKKTLQGVDYILAHLTRVRTVHLLNL